MKHFFRLALVGVLAVPLLIRVVAAQQTPPRGQETIEIRLRMVPFFVVDKHGNPVTDLRPDEVELRIDGKPVELAYFDRYLFTRTEREAVAGQAPTRPRMARNIFLLFDLAFSTHRGYRRSREVALKIIDQLFDTDRVFLLTYGGISGLKQWWGPVTGKTKVREKLIESLGLWRSIDKPPRAEMEVFQNPFNASANESSDPSEGSGRVANQDEIQGIFQEIISEAQAFNKWTYTEAAKRLAPALKSLANALKLISGPKILVVFSQGIRNDVYFGTQYARTSEKPTGFELATVGPFGQDDRTSSSFLHRYFEKALRELNSASVMTMFINPEDALTAYDAPRGGENALRHMARVTGGLYLGGTELPKLQERVTRWTSAYYEASFYLRNASVEGKRHEVTVKVKRPGVRVWTLHQIRDPKAYRNFNKQEKELYALQLVYKGPYRLSFVPAGANWERLQGHLRGEQARESTRYTYEVAWPAFLNDRKVDVYSILIDAPSPYRIGEPLRIRKDSRRVQGKILRLKEEVDSTRSFLWGIVLIDRDTGMTYWQRLYVRGMSP